MQQREIFETRASTYPNAFWSIWQICCFCFVCCMMYLCICVLPVEARDLLCVFFLYCFLSYLLRWHLSLNREFRDSARLAGQQAPGILPSLPAQHWVSGACLAFYVAWVLVLAMQAYWLSSFAGSQFSSYILSTLYRIGRSHDQNLLPS